MKPLKEDARISVAMEIPKRDQGLASLVNLGSIPFPYLAPIAGIFIGAHSPYVRFHAYRMLIEQLVGTLITGVLMASSLAYSVWKLKEDGVLDSTGLHTERIDWLGILIKSALTWVLFALWGVWNTLNSLKDALEAGRGHVPSKPRWSERMALKWSGLAKG